MQQDKAALQEVCRRVARLRSVADRAAAVTLGARGALKAAQLFELSASEIEEASRAVARAGEAEAAAQAALQEAMKGEAEAVAAWLATRGQTPQGTLREYHADMLHHSLAIEVCFIRMSDASSFPIYPDRVCGHAACGMHAWSRASLSFCVALAARAGGS